jgi:hypothetical protein
MLLICSIVILPELIKESEKLKGPLMSKKELIPLKELRNVETLENVP